MMSSRKIATLCFAAATVVVALSTPTTAAPLSFDLSGDYSSTNNPNGVWSYGTRLGGTDALLPAVQNWASAGQGAAWANGNTGSNFAPAIVKVQQLPFFDLLVGEVGVVTAGLNNSNVPGVGTQIMFTAPQAGVATITGTIWNATNIDVQAWQLFTNEAIPGGGGFVQFGGRANATEFSFTGVNFDPNEILHFVISGSPLAGAILGDFLGIALHVDLEVADVTQTPIPGALPLFASGLGALGLLLRRRRRRQSASAA